MQRILLVKLSSLGDIIHALPVACSLRATWPDCRLAWAVERRWLPLVEHHPAVDEVIAVDSFRFRRQPHQWRQLRDELGRLRAFRPDWALDLQGTLKSALVTRASGAPRRAGFSLGTVREPLSALFYNVRMAPRSAHVVHELLDLAEAIGPLKRDIRFPLEIPAAAKADVEEWIRDNHVGEFVFFSPGGGWVSKQWPSERYARLAELLQQRFGLSVVLNRGPGEERMEDAFRVSSAIRARLFSGDVPHLAAMLERARLVVGGDTGPLHLAAVLGAPVVALFGPTDPARNGPYSERAAVLRKPGLTTYRRGKRHSPAMLAIEVEEVEEACRAMLEPVRTSGAGAS